MEENKFLYELPDDTKDGDLDTKLVKRALNIIEQQASSDNFYGSKDVMDKFKPSRIEEYDRIEADYNNAGSTVGQIGSHWMFSKKTYNVVTRVISRWQLPKYSIGHKETKPSDDIDKKRIEGAIIKAGVELVLREGGFKRIFDGKHGAKFKVVLFGDAFILIETTNKKSFPINFRVLPLDRIYVNPEAICMRGSASAEDVRQLMIVIDYSYDTFRKEFKDYDVENVDWGELPSVNNYLNPISRTDSQNTESQLNRTGQIGIYFDLDAETYAIIAGKSATIIHKEEGKDYPFKKKTESGSENYIPVAQMFCSQRSMGFWNMGIGHLMSEVNQTDDFMKNQYILGLMKSVNPLDVLTVANNQTNQAMMRYEQALLDTLEGGHGVMINELDTNGNPLVGNVTKLSSGDVGQSYERFQSVIADRDIIGIGINEQDVATPASKTATAVEAEQAAADAMVQMLSEQNAPEIKFIIETAIDFIRKFVSDKDKTPINTSDIRLPEKVIDKAMEGVPPEQAEMMRPQIEQEIKNKSLKGFTLGNVAELLKKNEVEVTVDIGTGLKATSTRRIQQKRALLEMLMGTKAQAQVIQELAEEMGTSIPIKDLQPPEQPQAPQGGGAPAPEQMPL